MKHVNIIQDTFSKTGVHIKDDEEEAMLQRYDVRPASKLKVGDFVRAASKRDVQVVAHTPLKGRSGYTAITLIDPIALQHGSQIYRNTEKFLVKKRKTDEN